MRQSGILMHISSLPGPGGIGTLGQEAFAFVDFLKASGMKIWQVLPVGPVGYGESPYQSTSVYAGNPLLIDFPSLRRDGLLTFEDEELYAPAAQDAVDFPAVRENKELLLRRCFEQSAEAHWDEVEAFIRENAWVEDYGLFIALKKKFNDAMWTKWPERALRMRSKKALDRSREELKDEIRYHIFVQWLFFRQWFALKEYANANGISIFGDMPIYVAEDSADTWTNPQVFQLDWNRIPKRVAGVPPDIFSADGQLWGNPLYDWKYLQKTNFQWWVDRMRGMGKLYDIIRVDHFIGFANYYSIPYGAANARNGKWINAPGLELFQTLRQELPDLNVIAEDLGNLTDRVRTLLKEVGYPGMKVLTFAFDGGLDNPHHPANLTQNYVCYTGTHDNDTVLGWVETASPEARQKAQSYLHFKNPQEAPYAFLGGLFESVCDTVVAPMQDVLALPHAARMNLPGSIGGNWVWRMLPGADTAILANKLHQLNEATGRL